MADGTDTIYFVRYRKLVGAGIIHYCLLAARYRRNHSSLVWPDGVIATACSFATTGIDYEYHLYLSVAVPIVWGEVDAFSHGVAQTARNHRLNVHVLCIAIVLAIVSRFTKGVRTHYVEIHLKLAVALRLEVISHATLKLTLAETWLVGHAVVESLRVFHSELLVGELSQQDETLLLAGVGNTSCDAGAAIGVTGKEVLLDDVLRTSLLAHHSAALLKLGHVGWLQTI